ncbi:hypothetical protein JYP49_06450 [Nitratireductor aquimarinus]|nr:hypothetical protein [Nitratireductor pacificus]MBN7780222.1 hypothetical protein [Nitratireductor pacificus]MBN7789029.1 hypothetical protein [Nitratireductor aquimarinus]MBY6099097.1 hypothetical protein [Nitratireductor aquimarinus]
MRSDKPEARGFQDWVTKTVLPAISKDAAERRHAILPHQGRGNPRRVVISKRAKTNLAQPWFVARDLYLILFGTTTGVNARATVSSDETRLLEGDDFSASDALKSLRPLRGRPRLALLSESGLYKLVMRSDKPEAKVFQDWVTREVLPAIRKDGAYVMLAYRSPQFWIEMSYYLAPNRASAPLGNTQGVL